MKVVFKKNNKFVDYKIDDIEGYKFKPRKKINNLIIINREMINMILLKKIKKDINKVSITVKLMLDSNVTIVGDCNMMINEINRILKNIENKYRIYLDEFDYFELMKSLYSLNMELNLKKKLREKNIFFLFFI